MTSMAHKQPSALMPHIHFRLSIANVNFLFQKDKKEKRAKRKTPRCFLMTQEEDMMLQKDAYAHEMNISAYLRWLIKQEHKKKERE